MDDCAAFFRATHPSLVEHESEWLGSRFLADRATDTATIIATWRSLEAYRRYASGLAHREAMARCQRFFAAPPEVTVAEVLVEMERTSRGEAATSLAIGPG